MTLLIASFLAGVFTVAAPCILPLLPVILGGVSLDGDPHKRSLRKPLIISASLALSVVLFSLLLKATTAFLGIPQLVWNYISGGIVLFFGISLLAPTLWEQFMLKSGLYSASNRAFGTSSQKRGVAGDIILGASLGPIFSSCSPTYALIIAVILPSSFASGIIYLSAYALGLAGTLMLIALMGRQLTTKLGLLANPQGAFKKILGILFIFVGLFVITGTDKKVQSYILDRGWYAPIEKLEEKLMIM